MRHHLIRGLVTVPLFALVVIGCVSAPDDDPGGGSNVQSSDQPGSGGQGDEPMTLRVSVVSQPDSLNPVRGSTVDGDVWGAMFDSLADVDENNQLTDDGLLVDWEQIDELTWDFTVRTDVTFHNGEAFDAEAAAFTVNENRSDDLSTVKSRLATIVEARAIDDDTMRITTSEPNNIIPAIMARMWALPPEYYSEVGPEEFARSPVGTGPFEFESITDGQSITATRFEDYWRGAPQVDGVEWTYARDASARLTSLRTGAVDLVSQVPDQLIEQVETDPELKVVAGSPRGQVVMFIIDDAPPLDDPTLREAAARAVDVEAILETIFAGERAEAEPGLLSPFLEQPSEEFAVDHSPERARQLVQSVGETPTITLNYTRGSVPNDDTVGQAIAAMLEDVGFTVEQNPLDRVAEFDLVTSENAEGIFLRRVAYTYPHADNWTGVFILPSGITNTCHADGAEELASQGRSAPSVEERDEAYRQLERLVVDETFCFRSLYTLLEGWAASSRVNGFVPPAGGTPDYFPTTLG